MEFPAFPDDVPTAPIAAVSYANLHAEADKIYEACSTDGFFYLDLTGQDIVKQAEQLRDLSADIFDIPLEEKMKYLIGKENLSGYKAAGTKKTTDSTLRPDTTEFFNVFTDHVHGFTESRTYPPIIKESTNWNLFKQYTFNAHNLGNEILSVLANKLDVSFETRNAVGRPSGSHCRLTKKFPVDGDDNNNSIGLPSHTDFGSITILFNWLGGLQIQHRGAEWKYIKPLENHAIINLGDATRRFTNGHLLSAKHRVVPAPGEQANVDRYSVVYFIRPGDDVLMEPLEKFKAEGQELKKVAGKFQEEEDRVMTAGEWMQRRQLQMTGMKYD